MEQRDLIAAIATGTAAGAVGIVRLSGAGLSGLFEPLLGRSRLQPRLATLCRILDGNKAILDQGLALYFPAPASYTGEDVLELHGHGGRAVLESLLARCLELGARPATPGEFTYRAFLNGRMDLAQAEAVADLIDATSEAAARSAVLALSGAFSNEVHSIMADVSHLRVLAEAHLDFPDEDVDAFPLEASHGALDGIVEKLTALKRIAQRSQLLRGARVVIAGAPNVGKSSLLNRLAGDEVAIVTPIPGTTRDIVRASIRLHGIAVELLDTAGLHDSTDPIERIGMQRTLSSVEKADLVVAVEACSQAPAPRFTMSELRIPVLRVLNKIDLVREGDLTVPEDVLGVSAVTGKGIELLKDRIAEALGLETLEEGTFLARVRHIRQLDLAQHHAVAAREAPDLVLAAEELRLAQRALGEIVGQVTTEDLLGQIFSQFCIGK